MLLPAVLHPDVVDFLRTELDSNLKARVWECIEKLRQQQFDGGLRVKKLKGIAKRVWEARITQASRLIFTYNKSRQPDTRERQTYIAIQDICLDHDDVSRRAKARNQTPDAQWLDAEVVEAIGNILDERPVLTPAEQSALDAAQIEELQLVTSFTDELLGNIQWRIVDSELEWQRAIIQQDADLPLKLTPEEHELVKLYGNLLLSGSAGTGKTTVGLYRLLKSLETLPDGKRLYVAYNPILLKEAQKQFKRLVSGSNSEIESVFHFKTIRDLCIESLSQAGQFYLPEDEVTYQIFEQLYRRQSYQPYSPALVWDEIRSIIKGAHLETSSYQLSQKQYEKLGKKRSSVIPQKDRYSAYKVAVWYQGLLKKEGRFDEIDLAREVLKAIRQGKGEGYQLIVCDEVQDFTELQLELLVRLVAPGGHLFFAGDLHQMISPSGFRWEDLKTKFFKGERQAIQKTLNFNFRSVGSLVNLANQILKLRYRLLRERMSDIGQPTSSYGECARLIAAPWETLQPSLGQLNPDDAILVRTDADKKRLSEEFQSSFVFTIEEAKGLEFDTVFLVEFFKPRQSLWNRVLGSKRSLNETEQPELRLELNLLYVAVTRARRILNIWETQLSALWSQEELVSFLQPINSELVRENRVEPTEEMWRDRGCYYLECGFYRQAIECFEKSGDIELQRQTTAKLLLQEGKYSEAAQILVELQDWQQVAQLFEKVSQWQEAANYWEKAGNSPRQKICEAKAFETAKVWEDAAQLWEDLGRFEDAKRCWLKSGNEQKKAEIRAVEFEQKKQWLKAAEQYELAQMTQKAAEYRAKEFEKRKYWAQAAKQYKLAGISEKAEECRKRILPHSFAANMHNSDFRNYTRVLHFPKNSSVGKLSISNRGGWTPDDVWQEIGEARGDVSVPQNKKLKLDANKEASSDLSFLDALKPDDLYTLFNLTGVDDNELAHISRLTELYSLDIRMSRISDAGLVNLQNLTSLITLGLSDTNVGDEGMKYLQGLYNLKKLFISRTQVGNLGLSYLRHLTNLEDLNLTNTNVTDAGLEHLKGLRKLERLTLIGTQVSQAGWRNLRSVLPKCEITWIRTENFPFSSSKFSDSLHRLNDVDANITLDSDEPTAELAEIRTHQDYSETDTLNKLLLLNTEEAFKWMGKALEDRHTIASFANDINHWYDNGVQSRVAQAVEYKRSDYFDAAFAIYSDLFQEMPTWSPLYSSVYKVLASAGRLDEAERAIQLHSLLISFDYALRISAIAGDNFLDLNAALAQHGKFRVLAFWPSQDPTLLLHLGAVTMLKQGRMSKVAANGYLNSIKGQGSLAGCPPDGELQEEGRRVIMGLPWKAIANTETSGGFISQALGKIRQDCQ